MQLDRNAKSAVERKCGSGRALTLRGPPASLLAFLWHFARQAKGLFVALFVVEMFVALTDSAVPWFMGRIVTLVTTVPADRFLATTWPMLAGMACIVGTMLLLSQGWNELTIGGLLIGTFPLLAAEVALGGVGMGLAAPSSPHARSP